MAVIFHDVQGQISLQTKCGTQLFSTLISAYCCIHGESNTSPIHSMQDVSCAAHPISQQLLTPGVQHLNLCALL